MVALRILVPSVRVRVLPRQQRANHPYGGLLFFFLSPPEIVATSCGGHTKIVVKCGYTGIIEIFAVNFAKCVSN